MSSRGRQGNRDLQRRSMESLERANEVRLRRGTLPNADELRSATGQTHGRIFSFQGDPGQIRLEANSSIDVLIGGELRRVTNSSNMPAYFSSQDVRRERLLTDAARTWAVHPSIYYDILGARPPSPGLGSTLNTPQQRFAQAWWDEFERDSFSEIETRTLETALTGTVGARVPPSYPTAGSTSNGPNEWLKARPGATTPPKKPIQVEGQAFLLIGATWINDEVENVTVSFLGVQDDEALFSAKLEEGLTGLKDGLCGGVELCMSTGVILPGHSIPVGSVFKTKAGNKMLRDTFRTPHLKVYGVEVSFRGKLRKFRGLYEEETDVSGVNRVLGLRGGVAVIAVVPGQNLDFNQVLSDAFFEARETRTAGVGPGSSETDLPSRSLYWNRLRQEARTLPGEGPGLGIGNLRAMWAAVGRDMPPTAEGHISEAGRVRYQESIGGAVVNLDLEDQSGLTFGARNVIR